MVLLGLASCAAPAPGGGAPLASGAEPRPLEPRAPSPELRELSALIGSWDVRVEDLRGLEPVELARGAARVAPLLGGRFLSFELRFERPGGVLEARGTLGYDADHELYQLLWLSELAPGMRLASGRGRPRHGGVVLEIAEVDPTSGGVLRARSVLEVLGEDSFQLTQEGLDPETSDWRELQRTLYARRLTSAAASAAPGPR